MEVIGLIEQVSTKDKNIGVKVNGVWYSSFKHTKTGGEIPYISNLVKGNMVKLTYKQNGEFMNITNAELVAKPASELAPKETPKNEEKEMWEAKERRSIRGMVLSYVLEHLVSKDKLPLDKVNEKVEEYVNLVYGKKTEEVIPF